MNLLFILIIVLLLLYFSVDPAPPRPSNDDQSRQLPLL
jgi:hypothetical protein